MGSIFKKAGLVIFIYLSIQKYVASKETFIASFQPSIEGPLSATNDVWIEFTRQLKPTRDVTICHWIKIKFFNLKYVACLWSYCTVKRKGEKMKCLRLCLNGVRKSASRDLHFLIQIPTNRGTKYTSMIANISMHRVWSHVCWMFSANDGESKFYHNGHLFGIDQLDVEGIAQIVTDPLEMYDSALIFGQEPDIMRGKYDKKEAYLGNLAELNIWNRILSTPEVLQMASCKNVLKGNVISWTKSDIRLYNVNVADVSDISYLCTEQNQYVIFPQKLRYPEAKEMCAIHGGSLALPKSATENKAIIDIIFKHKDKCVDDKSGDEGNAVWIGAKKTRHKWYAIDTNNGKKDVLNYTNVKTTTSTPSSECAYLQNDGSWLDASFACVKVSLCTVCLIVNQPVLTIKGVCNIGDIDWNYYISTDDKNQINKYEGYKKTNILFHDESQSWNISIKSGHPQTFSADYSTLHSGVAYPAGRRQWRMTEPPCGTDDELMDLALSKCKFPTQFTCDSGDCSDINNRCNEQKDCMDGSDETACEMVAIPLSYNQGNKPKSALENTPLEMNIKTQIVNIDSIDTVNMIVTLTLEIQIKWVDSRLNYINPEFGKTNAIPHTISQDLWNPLQDLVHENAIIGEIIHENRNSFELRAEIPEDIDPGKPVENRIFSGLNNSLELRQRMKVKYNCVFDVKKFPYDGQDCHFVMKINQRKENTIAFSSDDNKVFYNGSSNVGQFSVGKMISTITNTETSTVYTISIPFKRIYTNQVLTAFIPTFILWLYGYSTLYIDPDCHIDRFMGAGTALLVVATLLSAINSDLPKTSYMKYIDLWFTWHVSSIFLMISYHIFLGRLQKYYRSPHMVQVVPFKDKNYKKRVKMTGEEKITWIDKHFIIAFPLLNSLFYCVYFYVTLT